MLKHHHFHGSGSSIIQFSCSVYYLPHPFTLRYVYLESFSPCIGDICWTFETNFVFGLSELALSCCLYSVLNHLTVFSPQKPSTAWRSLLTHLFPSIVTGLPEPITWLLLGEVGVHPRVDRQPVTGLEDWSNDLYQINFYFLSQSWVIAFQGIPLLIQVWQRNLKRKSFLVERIRTLSSKNLQALNIKTSKSCHMSLWFESVRVSKPSRFPIYSP